MKKSQATLKAKLWHKNNKWFGQDWYLTNYALNVHLKLLEEKINPNSYEYFKRLDEAMEKVMTKSKTPEPLYQQMVPVEDRGKTVVSKYYRVNQNMDGLGHSRHPVLLECNLRIDFGLDGGIYNVAWSNKVLDK